MADASKSSNATATTGYQAPTIGLEHLQAQQALFEHEQTNLNSNAKPVNGSLDKFDSIRLRIGIIENYTTNPTLNVDDPLDIEGVVNMNNGQVVISWLDYSGGIVRPDDYAYPSQGYTEPWTYYPDKDSKYPELRTLSCYNNDKSSDKEIISLTHSFIWGNSTNWCGTNYLPPVGSRVIVGFKKGNDPAILGYLQANYTTCKPYLKPGETMIKGYGDNYAHWRWSDKMDIHLKTTSGKIDIDDPYKKDVYPATIEMWMRFDTFTRNIFIDVNQTDSIDGKIARSTIEIKPETINIKTEDVTRKRNSSVTISTDDIYGFSTDGTNTSSIYIAPQELTMTSNGAININATGNVNISGSKINLN